VSSGDHLNSQIIQDALNRFEDIKFFNVYGLTEVGGRLCVLDTRRHVSKLGSVGKPLNPMTVDIKTNGEICVRGPWLFRSYEGGSDTGEEFATGDFGFKDEDGFLFIEGRRDSIFKSGAEKVSARLIEETLLSYPACRDAAVIGIPDSVLGKIPVAFVALNENETANQILRYLKERLPASHVPKKISVLPEIPRSGSGKILVGKLTEGRT
jgi:o-succinylbenzoate---CoA ligase